jgi:hypothetical protein
MGSRLKISRGQLSIARDEAEARRIRRFPCAPQSRSSNANRSQVRIEAPVGAARPLMPGIANGRKHPSRECSEDYLALGTRPEPCWPTARREAGRVALADGGDDPAPAVSLRLNG